MTSISPSGDMNGLYNVLRNVFAQPALWLCAYYGQVLEHPITLRQTWTLVRAQLLIILAVFPVYNSLLLHVAVAGLTVLAVAQCRDIVKREEKKTRPAKTEGNSAGRK